MNNELGTRMEPKSRRSWLAVLAAVVAAPFILPTAVLGIPLGLLGLWHTKGANRTGRKAAKWGLGLGLLSLVLILHPRGCTYYQPPVLQEDRELQQFLDHIAARRYDQAQNCRIITDCSQADFAAWADDLNARFGHGQIVIVKSRLYIIDPGNVYLIRFERGGWQTLGTGAPDWRFAREKGYALFPTAGSQILTPNEYTSKKRIEAYSE